jgi:hypothetical protein
LFRPWGGDRELARQASCAVGMNFAKRQATMGQ